MIAVPSNAENESTNTIPNPVSPYGAGSDSESRLGGVWIPASAGMVQGIIFSVSVRRPS